MRNALLLSTCLFLLSACGGMDDYWGGNSGGDGYNNGYGNGGYGGGYNGYNNGGYYPYGNANYPRDRIYIVNGYNPCNGYNYQGYCYRDKDDYRAAVIWDQNHRNDANWTKKRKDWCNHHDCSRDHDTHDRDDHYDHDRGTTDARGRSTEPQVERDRSERISPQQQRPQWGHPEQESRHHEGRNSYPATDSSSSSQPRTSSGGGQVQRAEPSTRHQQRQEPVQYSAPPVQRQQSVEPVQRSQPVSNSSAGGGRSQSQGRHGGKPVDLGATPE